MNTLWLWPWNIVEIGTRLLFSLTGGDSQCSG